MMVADKLAVCGGQIRRLRDVFGGCIGLLQAAMELCEFIEIKASAEQFCNLQRGLKITISEYGADPGLDEADGLLLFMDFLSDHLQFVTPLKKRFEVKPEFQNLASERIVAGEALPVGAVMARQKTGVLQDGDMAPYGPV